jgi:hypothetical protein
MTLRRLMMIVPQREENDEFDFQRVERREKSFPPAPCVIIIEIGQFPEQKQRRWVFLICRQFFMARNRYWFTFFSVFSLLTPNSNWPLSPRHCFPHRNCFLRGPRGNFTLFRQSNYGNFFLCIHASVSFHGHSENTRQTEVESGTEVQPSSMHSF